MPYEQKPNRMGLWFNTDFEGGTDRHMKGNGEAIGEAVWVSAWFHSDMDKEDKKALWGIMKRFDRDHENKPFLSISLQPKDDEGAGRSPAPRDDLDDEPPW